MEMNECLLHLWQHHMQAPGRPYFLCRCVYAHVCLLALPSTSKRIPGVRRQYRRMWNEAGIIFISTLSCRDMLSSSPVPQHESLQAWGARRDEKRKDFVTVNWVASWRWPIFITTDISEIMSLSQTVRAASRWRSHHFVWWTFYEFWTQKNKTKKNGPNICLKWFRL